jgi:hypothetical protein
MAVRGPFRVTFGDVFPFGAFVKGGVEPVRDFDRSTKEQFVQMRDKETGELVWSVDAIDADPESKGTLKIKVTSPVQPVLPEAPAGWPFIPVAFEGLTVTPYIDSNSNRLAYSLRAKAINAPGKPSAARTAARDAA